MKGDRVEVLVDAGNQVQAFEITAGRAGRRVEIAERSVVEEIEVTRTGQPVRAPRFMASRVIAIVEHPAERQAAPKQEQGGGPPPGRTHADRRRPP
jgi:hypothetical protein